MSMLNSWLWPNHVISKAESARLREEHNALVNEAWAMQKALSAIAEALDGTRNRFGKLETDPYKGEALRLLSIQYDTEAGQDKIEQAVNVARAAVAKVRS